MRPCACHWSALTGALLFIVLFVFSFTLLSVNNLNKELFDVISCAHTNTFTTSLETQFYTDFIPRHKAGICFLSNNSHYIQSETECPS